MTEETKATDGASTQLLGEHVHYKHPVSVAAWLLERGSPAKYITHSSNGYGTTDDPWIATRWQTKEKAEGWAALYEYDRGWKAVEHMFISP